MEALSAGCPIIAADCTAGPREILENGETGRLVPARDSAALSQELRHLIDNPELDVEGLMEYIPGPDFPTAGIINGVGGIQKSTSEGFKF